MGNLKILLMHKLWRAELPMLLRILHVHGTGQQHLLLHIELLWRNSLMLIFTEHIPDRTVQHHVAFFKALNVSVDLVILIVEY